MTEFTLKNPARLSEEKSTVEIVQRLDSAQKNSLLSLLSNFFHSTSLDFNPDNKVYLYIVTLYSY